LYGKVLTRIYSTFYNPNVFAGFLGVTISFSLSRFVYNSNDKLNIANIIISSICIILTYSRGGFIGLMSAVVILLIIKRDKRIALYLICMILLFFYANHTPDINRISMASKDSSRVFRVEVWKAAINMFFNNIITGHGVGTTWYALSGFSDKLWSFIFHAHNLYLQISAEMGIIGLAAFVYFSIKNLLQAYKLQKAFDAEPYTYVFVGFIMAFISVLVHGMADSVAVVPNLSIAIINYYALYRNVAMKCIRYPASDQIS
jgi:putative inorganic carbon (HCO3(-)) transporter